MSIQAPRRPWDTEPDRPFWPDVWREEESFDQEPSSPRVDRLKGRRRRQRWRTMALFVLILVLASAGVLVFELQQKPPRAVPAGPAPASLAWSVTVADHSFVAVVGVRSSEDGVVVAIPETTLVDLPGAPTRVGDAAGQSPQLMLAAVQSTVAQRIGHYVASDEGQFEALVDRLGGVPVQVEAGFTSGDDTIQPGVARLSGAQVLDYLASGTTIDRTGRWEEVLAGLMNSDLDDAVRGEPIGQSDDPEAVANLLAEARDATVLEIPTSPAVGGGLSVDRAATATLLKKRFPRLGAGLVRVIVINGNGSPGLGAAMSELLAPAGFRVIASQNAASFAEPETKVVAGTDQFLARAQQARFLIGAGKVYVGRQPTSVADITILVGKDFEAD